MALTFLVIISGFLVLVSCIVLFSVVFSTVPSGLILVPLSLLVCRQA